MPLDAPVMTTTRPSIRIRLRSFSWRADAPARIGEARNPAFHGIIAPLISGEMMPDISTIYLIRHATPDWTRTDIPYHLPPGPPLTTKGEDEAARLGLFLKQSGVASIFTSPLERARRTAEIVTAIIGVPTQLDDGLTELQPGEEVVAVRARIEPVWEKAGRLSQQDGPVALVTHGGPIAIWLETLGMPKATIDAYRLKFDRNNPVPPGGAWKATCITPQSNWALSLAFIPDKDGAPDVAHS
jgi:broad specificity phosphatase PhoE